MEIINNENGLTVVDKLKSDIHSGCKLSIISAYMTIYAYSALKKELGKIENLRLLFSEPTFISDKQEMKREFMIGNYEDGLAGDKYELKLKGELNQATIAKECAKWIREKVEVRAFNKEYALPTKCFIMENKSESSLIYGNSDFNSTGLGLVYSKKPLMNTYIKDTQFTMMYKQQFEQFWNDASAKDVKNRVLERLEGSYKENSPELLYFVTLFHIFKNYLDEVDEDLTLKNKTGFKNSLVWNKLYAFQKDGVLGTIDKIEKYNGCIIADSVGLGKTLEALAVIKYYELRNHKVLVLCPKKLRENWITYRQNDKRNIFANDRFNFDVLNHTDLSRNSGYSGDINLESIYWENYDLIVIDESHNFRNGTIQDKETRYSRLLNKVIKSGTKTKVLMLSATPVNNRLTDLKNQLSFITEGRDNAFEEEGIKSIERTLSKAQAKFNEWNHSERKVSKELIELFDLDYFKLLDMLTIARSRKHIEKYYNMNEIGKFPKRLAPINHYSEIDSKGEFPAIKEVNDTIRRLNLSIYTPMKYVRRDKKGEYEKKYDTKLQHSTFRQEDREESLIHLIRVNLLKRLESSIHSFGITLSRIEEYIDNTIEKIKQHYAVSFDDLKIGDIAIDDSDLDDFMVGSKKVKILIQDIDLVKWEMDLKEDLNRIREIREYTLRVDNNRDEKLRTLKSVIESKLSSPINSGNKKIIVFTAFADTAKYLYENVGKWFHDTYHLNSALVTGSDENKTTVPKLKSNLNTILTHFSPISKERDRVFQTHDDIDLLIATDCISEGQNLQDCDFLVNYDIHWNPVRIVQRFGRIDRIGSRNSEIQLVNFWPNMALDEYIDLEHRVSGRMVLLDISATGEENIISQDSEMKDLEYRKNQLEQLKQQVVDLEDMGGNISLTDLNFNDFKIELKEYIEHHKQDVANASTGMYAISSSEMGVDKGVIFCLKQVHKSAIFEQNPLQDAFLVYVKESGEVLFNYLQSKKILDRYKLLCRGQKEVFHDLVNEFNHETEGASNMKKYTKLLKIAIEAIEGKQEEKSIHSLFGGESTFKKNEVQGIENFELVSFLVIK